VKTPQVREFPHLASGALICVLEDFLYTVQRTAAESSGKKDIP
jgi:hypothetical protein